MVPHQGHEPSFSIGLFDFGRFDSLRPINILSVIKGLVFLGCTSTKLGLMFLLKDTTQWHTSVLVNMILRICLPN